MRARFSAGSAFFVRTAHKTGCDWDHDKDKIDVL